ncbi:MAG: YqgE/AlgH family protein [Granulosicoccus sp.]
MDLSHHFLLSMPQMRDSHFRESLIYLLDHDKHGAFGVVINHNLGMQLGEVLLQLQIKPDTDTISEITVLRGGPVDPGHGLVLHPPGNDYECTRNFGSDVSMSSSRDVLEAIAHHEGPEDYLVLLGHAGWGPGQLEVEIADNAWLTCPATTDIIFHTALDERRHAVGEKFGIKLEQMVGHAGHA